MTRKVGNIDPASASPPSTLATLTDAAAHPAGQLVFDIGLAKTTRAALVLSRTAEQNAALPRSPLTAPRGNQKQRRSVSR
jgi:hypothetical protein